MKSLKELIVLSIVGTLISGYAYAQETSDQYNPNSLEPIPKYEHLYKMRVWRIINLEEKQNKGFFARGGEISRLLINAVKSGELVDIYETDSLTTKISKEAFLDKLQAQEAQPMDPWSPTANVYEGDYVTYNGKNYVALTDHRGQNPEQTMGNHWDLTTVGKAQDFQPYQISRLILVEDLIFDKRRSRLYHDIQAIMPVVPGEQNFLRGNIDVNLGWFKYKDLVQVFRNHPDEALWFNRNNTAENKNFEDAFKLRLFKGVIEKIENPENETVYDKYVIASGRPYIESVWAREWEEMILMEREHNLWEF